MRRKHVRQKRVFRKPLQTQAQPLLLPASLDDLVPEGHMVRSLKASLEEMDLSALVCAYDDKGGVPYPPGALLGALLFGLMDGERSSRRIQEHCRFDVRYRYLTLGLEPDDRTICRFRRRLEPVLPELFAQVLALARGRGPLKMNVVALDGTKVAGNVSQWRRILKQAEDGDSPISDPDARTMQAPKGGHLNGYNAQAAVDAGSGIVVAAEVTQSPSDYAALPVMVEQAQRNVGQAPKALVADKGYESAANAEFLEKKGIAGYLHPREQDQTFWRVSEEGDIVCPRGCRAVHRDRFPGRGTRVVRLYVKECPCCPAKPGCHSAKHKYLHFPDGVNPAARIRNAHRCRSPEGRAMLKMRAPAVETLFGHLKGGRRFTRFLLRGLGAVRSEFRLECLAYNLRKVSAALILWLLRLCRGLPRPIPRTWASPVAPWTSRACSRPHFAQKN